MKILYGLQGTGNGHLTRAIEVLPALEKRGEVDVLVSGVHSEIPLPVEPTYRMHGLGFVFGKNGGIDVLETYKKSRLKKFYKDVSGLDVSAYDLIISDFEPVSAWAAMRQRRAAVGISNQVSLLSAHVPKAESDDFMGRFIIRNYAPTPLYVGLTYDLYARHLYTPIIRKSLRNAVLSDDGHYLVYLPSYSDEKLLKVLTQLDTYDFHVFSKHSKDAYRQGRVQVYPLNKDRFEASLRSASGVISAAGFGTSTEALYMGKKLLVIPQKRQYEQACNAEALRGLGIDVLKSFKRKHIVKIQQWLDDGESVRMEYPDRIEEIIDDAIDQSFTAEDPYSEYLEREQYLLKPL